MTSPESTLIKSSVTCVISLNTSTVPQCLVSYLINDLSADSSDQINIEYINQSQLISEKYHLCNIASLDVRPTVVRLGFCVERKQHVNDILEHTQLVYSRAVVKEACVRMQSLEDERRRPGKDPRA